MDRDRVARLTPQQLVCVRLIPRLYTDKAIAAHLGLSARTVQAHVAAARATLQVTDRFAAAALVAASDTATSNSPKQQMPIPVSSPAAAFIDHNSNLPDRVQDVAVDLASTFAPPPPIPDRAPARGARHDAKASLQIITLIAAIAVFLAALIIVVAASADSWSRLANVIEPFQR